MHCGEVCKDETVRTFVNCSKLEGVWINSRLLWGLVVDVIVTKLLKAN